jgi:hypothetical protein
METSSSFILPITSARRSARKEEGILRRVSFVLMPLLGL